MRSCTSERWSLVALLFVLLSQTWGVSSTASAAIGQETLLPSTPLVLKDGRIANVSIHLLPFDGGDGALTGDAAAALSRLTAQIATDCFLTAQVIGHVSSREVADNETLEAHRLARSRADTVQSSLIGGGLPAKSIASVWDWQFLVREPRATLWVFRLIEGEDCEGAPLDGAAPQLVAENVVPQQAQPPQADEPEVAASAAPASERAGAAEEQPTDAPEQVARTETPAPARAEPEATTSALPPVVGSAVAAEPTPEQGEAQDSSAALDALVDAVVEAEAQLEEDAREHIQEQAASESPASGDVQVTHAASGSDESGSQDAVGTPQERPRVVTQAGAAVGAVPTITRPIPALSPSQPDAVASDQSAETTVAAIDPAPASNAGARPATTAAVGAQQSAKPEDPDRQGKVEWGKDGNVVITFATNSSYFPPGTARRLSSMIDGMTHDQPYRVQLQVGVSGTDTVVGATSPEEARRYNQWLAERRMARVRDWLTENAKDRQLEIEPVFQQDESSRRVLVLVAPVG